MTGAKPGCEIDAISDRQGLPLTVLVSVADVNDHEVLHDVVDSARPVRRPRKQPGKLHGDQGHDYKTCRDLLTRRNITARIACAVICYRRATKPDLLTSNNP